MSLPAFLPLYLCFPSLSTSSRRHRDLYFFRCRCMHLALVTRDARLQFPADPFFSFLLQHRFLFYPFSIFVRCSHIARFKLIFLPSSLFHCHPLLLFHFIRNSSIERILPASPDLWLPATFIIYPFNRKSFMREFVGIIKIRGGVWSIYLFLKIYFRSFEGAPPLSSGRTLSTNLFNAIWMGVLSMHTTSNQRVPSTRRERTSSF